MSRALKCLLVCFLATLVLAGCGEDRAERVYVCPPCAPHDTLPFDHDGTCPIRGMELVERPDSARPGHLHLHEGSGSFLIEGGPGRREKVISVYYHRPESFTAESPVLMVVPGSGRDAWEYRDAWVEAARAHGVLVLSPRYPEATYGFEDYHMGGVIEDSNLEEVAEQVDGSSQVRLDEERAVHEIDATDEDWIFHDFDRLFETVASAVGSERSGYDLFGHSAGGQILHRLVLFHPDARAHRIVAANAGFYTLPDPGTGMPFGLENAPVGEEEQREALGRRLVLLLGEEDDHPEAGGIFLRSPSADEQGAGRLQRGRHFHTVGRATARDLDADFGWRIEVVPGVGHDSGLMSQAAARYLYGEAALRRPAAAEGEPTPVGERVPEG